MAIFQLKVEVEAQGHGDKFGLNQNLSHYILIKDQSDDKEGVNAFLENLTQFLSYSQEEDSRNSVLFLVYLKCKPLLSLNRSHQT